MTLTAAQKGKGRALSPEDAGHDTEEATTTLASISDSNSDSSFLRSGSGSESGSDSGSDSGSSTSTPGGQSDSDSDSDDEITPAYLESLLEKARQSARAKKAAAAAFGSIGEEEEVIKLDAEPDVPTLPSLDPGKLPQAYIVPGESRKAGPSKIHDPDVEKSAKLSAALSAPAPPEPPRDNLTKRQRKDLKKKTAGADWFDLPAPAEADLPRLYREVEALRLRNQLDPKRFYRKEEGEGKGIKGLPKHFAIGTIVPTKNPFGGASADLPRSARKRTLVDELVDDAEARSYAKKKFRELQAVRGARGRGTLAKKREGRKPKW